MWFKGPNGPMKLFWKKPAISLPLPLLSFFFLGPQRQQYPTHVAVSFVQTSTCPNIRHLVLFLFIYFQALLVGHCGRIRISFTDFCDSCNHCHYTHEHFPFPCLPQIIVSAAWLDQYSVLTSLWPCTIPGLLFLSRPTFCFPWIS